MKQGIEIPPFYLGQEVVALYNQSQGDFKKGDEFKITGIWKDCCGWTVTIGIKYNYLLYNGTTTCNRCGQRYVNKTNEAEYYADRFSPKIEVSAFVSMKEVANVELFAAN